MNQNPHERPEHIDATPCSDCSHPRCNHHGAPTATTGRECFQSACPCPGFTRQRPPDDVADAIVRFAQREGKVWKRRLRECWERSIYPGATNEDRAALQWARNAASLGPAWLTGLRADMMRELAKWRGR